MVKEAFLKDLNSSDLSRRLKALEYLIETQGDLLEDCKKNYINMHLHTTYSFSPYSPSKIIWLAKQNRLNIAGIVDHDTIAGASEFLHAGKIADINTTVGLELRVNLKGTPLENRIINNPDQKGVMYSMLYGIPEIGFDAVTSFLEPVRKSRMIRNRKMTENLNKIISPYGFELNFDRDVLPLSMAHDGGTVTERHLLFAFVKKLIKAFPDSRMLVKFLEEKLHLLIPESIKTLLYKNGNPYYEYDLLGALKSEFLQRFYLEADDMECPHASTLVALAEHSGSLATCSYLGDVKNSVTGDKKEQNFEDGYLEEWFEVMSGLGFKAITYAPSRNTTEQLKRLQSINKKYHFVELSGEDINSPRQRFVTDFMERPEFSHLTDAAIWLISRGDRA